LSGSSPLKFGTYFGYCVGTLILYRKPKAVRHEQETHTIRHSSMKIPGWWSVPHLSRQRAFGLIPGYVAMKMRVRKGWCVGSGCLTISLTSSAEPGSTEQADTSVLEGAACKMSNKYSAYSNRPSNSVYHPIHK